MASVTNFALSPERHAAQPPWDLRVSSIRNRAPELDRLLRIAHLTNMRVKAGHNDAATKHHFWRNRWSEISSELFSSELSFWIRDICFEPWFALTSDCIASFFLLIPEPDAASIEGHHGITKDRSFWLPA